MFFILRSERDLKLTASVWVLYFLKLDELSKIYKTLSSPKNPSDFLN